MSSWLLGRLDTQDAQGIMCEVMNHCPKVAFRIIPGASIHELNDLDDQPCELYFSARPQIMCGVGIDSENIYLERSANCNTR